ncbi:MAG: sodium:calcium antiporter [Candidatus Bathyarchaeota archaeon]|nr:sodium:calcium antiporter [Candidatus Bathyarchaeota archaeon]
MDFPYFSIIVLIGGLVGLGVGAELTINCSIKTAWRFGLSPFLIGLTLVSIGTSIPEMAVGIAGGIDRLEGIETSGIVVGNYVGSVLNVMTIILGICGLFGTLVVSKKTTKRIGSALMASLLLFFIIILDYKITILEGFVLIITYIGFTSYLIYHEKKLESLEIPVLEDKIRGFKVCKMEDPAHLDIILLIVGIIVIGLGADAVIMAGIELATFMSVEQSAIGLIFVGFGTGIPELIVSARALSKGDVSISVGNLLGSSITDILLATGMGAMIAGFIIDKKTLLVNTPITIAMTLLALIFLMTGEKLDRKESLLLIIAYIFIAVFVFLI